MIRFLLECLSACDWISPAIETAKDFSHFATGINPTLDISVNKGDLWLAKLAVKKSGYQLISTTTVGFNQEALLTVECFGGVDGYDSVRMIMEAIRSNGVECWVYPDWA